MLNWEQLKNLPKKKRKEIKRILKEESVKKLKLLRKISKIFFWSILLIIFFGGLYILMALTGYL